MLSRVLVRVARRELRDRTSVASVVSSTVSSTCFNSTLASPSSNPLDEYIVALKRTLNDGCGRAGRRNRTFSTGRSLLRLPPQSASAASDHGSEEGLSLFGIGVPEEDVSTPGERLNEKSKSTSTSWWNCAPRDEEEATRLEHELISYFQTSIFNGDILHAEKVLRKQELGFVTAAMFHVFLRAYLKRGQLDEFVETLRFMESRKVAADADVYALTLAAYGQSLDSSESSPSSSSASSSNSATQLFLRESSVSMSCSLGLSPTDAVARCHLLVEEKRLIHLAASADRRVDVEEIRPSCDSSPISLDYDCDLVDHLNEKSATTYPNPHHGAFDLAEAKSKLKEIWRLETFGQVFADRVDERTGDFRDSRRPTSSLDLHREMWRKSIGEALECHLSVMRKKRFDESSVSLYPYVKLFTVRELTDFLVDEIDQIVLWTHKMAFPNHVLAARIGRIFAIRAVAKQHALFGDYDTFERVYSRYLEFSAAEEREFPTERHFWDSMRDEFPFLSDMDVTLRYWPQSVRLEFGHLLFHVVVGEALFNPRLLHEDGGEFLPVFAILTKKIRANSEVYRLYDEAAPVPQSYPSTELPTRLPPMPWISATVNGSVLSDTAVIRFERDDKYSHETLCAVKSNRLFPPLDALNHLGSCPWTVNGFVLDVASEVFNSGGCPGLGIPLTRDVEASRAMHTLNQARITDNKNWFSAFNNLSLAHRMRDQVFWHPHHMDYRGRCTPIPAFLNHHGPDLVRGLITFASRKPLGEKGFDWLKIHAINVAGLKKQASLSERLEYADEIMDEILDSARRPLDGNGWWKRGDKPWETLAACKEIADALAATPSTRSFLTRLPIHQDGTCNSLQHFSALARDQLAGELVNLSPSERPKDPYTDIIRLLESKRRADASRGRREALVLEGFLERDIVKKIVMRVGYGASRESAIGYVEKWLQDMDHFPKSHVRKCSQYLGVGILECNYRLFKSSDRLRRWLVQVADIVTAENSSVVFWNSPLGLPIHQPPLPHIFVPNYIHSLDAAHMMLTTLHAHRSGVTFCAVHDCFWTHAGTVDAMNDISRRQFLRLHSSGLLESLLDQCSKLAVIEEKLPPIPPRGKLDIEKVVESLYFFQ